MNNKQPELFIFFIPYLYPAPDMYRVGVEILSLNEVRNQPNAKITNLSLRTLADKIISDKNVYEVLLVNQEGFITEGSRSNIFFIKDKVVFTPPTSIVLPGITREKVLEICNNLGIETHREMIPLSGNR